VQNVPPPPPRPNQRKHVRYELLASVEVHQGEDTLILPARNLSLGGIYIGSDGNDLSRFRVGNRVELLLFDATNESNPPIRGAARVVRHDDAGIALTWEPDEETTRAIKSLLGALQAQR
jgi:hypothetical protein